jgi:hypothetical protein
MDGRNDGPLDCRQTRLVSQSEVFFTITAHDGLFPGEHNGYQTGEKYPEVLWNKSVSASGDADRITHGASSSRLRVVGVGCHYLLKDSIRPGFPRTVSIL